MRAIGTLVAHQASVSAQPRSAEAASAVADALAVVQEDDAARVDAERGQHRSTLRVANGGRRTARAVGQVETEDVSAGGAFFGDPGRGGVLVVLMREDEERPFLRTAQVPPSSSSVLASRQYASKSSA